MQVVEAMEQVETSDGGQDNTPSALAAPDGTKWVAHSHDPAGVGEGVRSVVDRNPYSSTP